MYHEMRWTLDKIKRRLGLISPLVYSRQSTLPDFRFMELAGPLVPPPVGIDVDDSTWQVITPNSYWGTWMTDFVLRTTFTIPNDWDKELPVALHFQLGEAGDFSHPEALVYIDGKPYATCDRHHQEVLLRPEWADGKSHTLALHGWTGLGSTENIDFFTKLFMRHCSVVQIHTRLRELIILTRVAVETAGQLTADDPIRSRLLNALNDAFCRLETRTLDGETFYASVEPALEVLRAGISKAGSPLDVSVHASGHAHIDVAWLWTLGQTHRKAERTFTNVLRYMEQFPDYHYSQSQPQLYDFIRQDSPELFKAIQTQGQGGPLGTDGRHVGRSRLQPERCRIACAPIPARADLLSRAFRKGCRKPGAVAAGCVRLCLGAAAVDPAGRAEILHDHQDRLESIQPAAI